MITIVDATNPADGVQITADPSGGATPATIAVEGGASTLSLTAGDQLLVSHGSVVLDVLAGTVDVTFVADSGQFATASLTSGTNLTFQPETFSFVAPADNPQTVQIVVDGNGISIPPGETVLAARAVTINIQSQSLNLDSEGTLTVFIYGALDFDATQINVNTVRFAGAVAWQSTLVDANHDGRLDMQLKFRRQDTILDQIYANLLLDDEDADGVLDSTRQTARISLTGRTLDDVLFSGADSINLFLAGRSLRNLLDNLFA